MKTKRITNELAAGLFILALLLIAGSAYAAGPGGVSSGLAVWLDAQNVVLSTANPGYVKTWTDTSGLGNNLTAYYDQTQYMPTYQTSQVNGLPVISCGYSTNAQLKNLGNILTGTTMTAFMVYKQRNTLAGVPGIAQFGGIELTDTANGKGNIGVNAWPWTTQMTGVSTPYAAFGLQTIVFNGASSFCKLNGTLSKTGDMTGVYSGGALRIGARTNTSGSDPSDFAEVIVYNSALSTSDENAVGAYLSAKYNLTTTYYQPANSGVQGQVTKLGLPFSGAVVTTVPAAASSFTTDSTGNYSIVVAPGTYTVQATKDGDGTAQQSGVVVNTGTYTTVNLAFSEAYGTVTASNLPGAPPVIGAMVRALGTNSVTYTGSDGGYRLILPTGAFPIEASKDHYSTDVQVLVAGDQAQLQNFSLAQDGTWDLATDYTTICNPAGQWSLGLVDKVTNAMTPFTQQSGDNGFTTAVPWMWDLPSASGHPMDSWAGAVGRNCLLTPITSGGTYIEPGDVMLYGGGGYLDYSPGYHNGITTIRWTAPDTRTIHIYLKAFSQYISGAASPVSVRKNNASMIVRTPNGFVGRSASGYTDSVGPAPVATFSTDIPVSAGDTIDFSIGQYGNNDLLSWTWNATFRGDGIIAQISPGNGIICNTVADLKARNVGDVVFATVPMQILSSTGGEWSFDKQFNASGTEQSFYLQSDDRMQGIKCLADAGTPVYDYNTTSSTPWKITFTGVIATDYLGQKAVRILSVNGAVAGTVPKPLGKGSKALTNSNTLVQVWGKITSLVSNPAPVMWEYPAGSGTWYKDYDYEYITINDGGQDVKIPLHVQKNYMSSYDSAILNLAVGHYIAVRGIAGTTTGADVAVYPRNVADINDYTSGGY